MQKRCKHSCNNVVKHIKQVVKQYKQDGVERSCESPVINIEVNVNNSSLLDEMKETKSSSTSKKDSLPPIKNRPSILMGCIR